MSLPLQITEWKSSASRRVVGLFQWIERFAIGGARAVVAISPAVERAARSAVPSANVVTIVNHFELGEAVTAVESSGIRAKYGIAADAPLVVYTGSFVELQALPLLIDAVPLICQQVPGRVLPVGGTDEEIRRSHSRRQHWNAGDRLEPARPQADARVWLRADAGIAAHPRHQPAGQPLPYLGLGKTRRRDQYPGAQPAARWRCAFLTSPDAQGAGGDRSADRCGAQPAVSRAAGTFLQVLQRTARKAAYSRLFR